jgi:hypothetical protein
MNKYLLLVAFMCFLAHPLWSFGEVPREPYREVSGNVELYGNLKFKMREQIQKHEAKIAQSRELRNAIPERQYKDMIEKHQEAINALERYANRDVQFYYDYAYKLPKQERNEGYSNVEFTEFLKQKLSESEN